METKKVTFIVSVDVAYDSEHAWQRNVRIVRKTVKETILAQGNMKILKIDSKEG